MSNKDEQRQSTEVRVRNRDEAGVALEVAGLGTRSYAYVVDFHIRVLGVLVWFLVVGLVSLLVPDPRDFEAIGWIVLVLLTPALFYFLYHPVLEIVMRGRTPGKRMAGVRLVATDGSPAGALPLLVRNLFRIIDSLPQAYVVGFVTCFFHPQGLRLGDMAAGTVLVHEPRVREGDLAEAASVLRNSWLTPSQQATVTNLLERWSQLQPERRKQLAETLLHKLEGGLPDSPTGALPERALRQRLEALLHGGADG